MAKQEASVSQLVNMIEKGQIQLPEMQRKFVWKATKVRDLLDSLYRGYPSGTILMWEPDETVALTSFSVNTEQQNTFKPMLLLDGQQRLTSLSSVLRGEPVVVRRRRRPIDILFNLEHPENPLTLMDVDEDDEDDFDSDEVETTDDVINETIQQMTFVVANSSLPLTLIGFASVKFSKKTATKHFYRKLVSSLLTTQDMTNTPKD